MGGRIYDPLLGRFLQADPFVQAPSNTASLNRYSYVWNNPLNATDPSGFFLDSLWDEIRPFVSAIVTVVVTIYCPACGPIVAGMIGGAVGAAANGGNVLKGAVFGAFSGAAYVAGGFVGSAVWGGIEADMNGGSFGRGFLAAGIGAYYGGMGTGPSISGFVKSAVLGGVTTEITGGKFKNGAASAAFMYAVSAGVGASRGDPPRDCKARCEEKDFSAEERQAVQKQIDDLAGPLKKASYSSYDAAAKALHESGLAKLFDALGIEGWAVIDRKTFAIKSVGTGFSSLFAEGVYNRSISKYVWGDVVWHTHPDGGPAWYGDLNSAIGGGATRIYASGKSLTYIASKPFDILGTSSKITTYQDWEAYSGPYSFDVRDVYSGAATRKTFIRR